MGGSHEYVDETNYGTVHRSNRWLIVFMIFVIFAELWAGLASPRHPGANLIATLASFVGIPIVLVWWLIACIQSRGRIGTALYFMPLIVLALIGVLWLGISNDGLMLRFRWSRAALDKFIAELPEGYSEPQSSRWIGYIHVGGYYQTEGATILHVNNGLLHSFGIGHVPNPPMPENTNVGDLLILKRRLDPPWYFVSYDRAFP